MTAIYMERIHSIWKLGTTKSTPTMRTTSSWRTRTVDSSNDYTSNVSWGVLAHAHAHEVLLQDSTITWRTIGGSIDLYFYDGPSRQKSPRTIKQVLLDCLLCSNISHLATINVDGDIQAGRNWSKCELISPAQVFHWRPSGKFGYAEAWLEI